jgi:hypothetical protein
MKNVDPKRKTHSISGRTPANGNLHNNAARVLLLGLERGQWVDSALRLIETYLSIEHLTLGGQTVTLGDQRVDLLTTLQNTLDLSRC